MTGGAVSRYGAILPSGSSGFTWIWRLMFGFPPGKRHSLRCKCHSVLVVQPISWPGLTTCPSSTTGRTCPYVKWPIRTMPSSVGRCGLIRRHTGPPRAHRRGASGSAGAPRSGGRRAPRCRSRGGRAPYGAGRATSRVPGAAGSAGRPASRDSRRRTRASTRPQYRRRITSSGSRRRLGGSTTSSK